LQPLLPAEVLLLPVQPLLPGQPPLLALVLVRAPD
jgi:hypothetical protein